MLWSFNIFTFKRSATNFENIALCGIRRYSVFDLLSAKVYRYFALELDGLPNSLLSPPPLVEVDPTLVEVKTACFNRPNPSTRSWRVWSWIRSTICFLGYYYAGVALHNDQSLHVLKIIWWISEGLLNKIVPLPDIYLSALVYNLYNCSFEVYLWIDILKWISHVNMKLLFFQRVSQFTLNGDWIGSQFFIIDLHSTLVKYVRVFLKNLQFCLIYNCCELQTSV